MQIYAENREVSGCRQGASTTLCLTSPHNKSNPRKHEATHRTSGARVEIHRKSSFSVVDFALHSAAGQIPYFICDNKIRGVYLYVRYCWIYRQ